MWLRCVDSYEAAVARLRISDDKKHACCSEHELMFIVAALCAIY